MATYKKPCMHCRVMIAGDARFCPACGSGSPFGYVCPSCLRDISTNETFCGGCGRPLRVPCPACGMQIFAGCEACENCGAPLMVQCDNPRCGQRQFFQNEKCTACGKKMRKGR